MDNFQWSSSSNNNLLLNNNREVRHIEMSKHKLRIRREKRNKLHKMKRRKIERGKEMKNYGADFFEKTINIVRSYWGL